MYCIFLGMYVYVLHRARDVKRGRDSTRYSRLRPASFLTHHVRAVSVAAVFGDAEGIVTGIDALKIRALSAAARSVVAP